MESQQSALNDCSWHQLSDGSYFKQPVSADLLGGFGNIGLLQRLDGDLLEFLSIEVGKRHFLDSFKYQNTESVDDFNHVGKFKSLEFLVLRKNILHLRSHAAIYMPE